MTETEALTAIAALDLSAHDAEQVRAVLARVGSGAVPPHDIDRDALFNLLRTRRAELIDDATTVDLILALLRPVEGVVIRHDLVGDVVLALRHAAPTAYGGAVELRWLDIAEGLEAAR